jgi:isopenicillin-N epimerase
MPAQPPPSLPGARLLFSLDPAVAHLNHGAFGAVPIPVQRVQQRLRDELEANPVRFFAVGLDERLAHTRRHLAGFIGADPDGSALVTNATTAVSVVLGSLDLAAGDEIVTTNHGYGAVDIAVDHWCQRVGAHRRVAVLPVAPTNDEVVDAVRASVSGRTRLVVLDHITSPTARLFPVGAVVRALRGSAIPVLVDGAHVPGLLPVHVSELGADFWLGNFHKWGFAPRGTALLCVAPTWRDRIRPPVIGWSQLAGFPDSVERYGSGDYTSWLAASSGLFVMRTLGPAAVREHNGMLAAYAQRVVGAALGHKAADLPDHDGGSRLPMRIVPLPNGLAADIGAARALRQRIADELDAEVSVNPWPGGGLLRLSAQVYNTAAEYERLAERLPALLAGA